jgi:hypothetical protein
MLSSSTQVQQGNGLRALLKLVVFGQNPNYFTSAELQYVDNEASDNVKKQTIDTTEIEGVTKKPNRIRVRERLHRKFKSFRKRFSK